MTDTQYQPGQRVVVSDGSEHTFIGMLEGYPQEPARVVVEGGEQWLESGTRPVDPS